jgi:SAM-dependent methyltransferase
MPESGSAAYYDRLTRWNTLARVFGYGGGISTLTVHRALADPRAAGRATPTRLHELLFEHLPAMHAPLVLDAGCGLGGTMIECARRLSGRCVGLTLSASQAAAVAASAARTGLGDRVQAIVRSYDDPPPGPFDLVVAIESLAHSPNPRVSLTALARVLAPRGTIAIVDDMPEPATAGGGADLRVFKDGWRCPVLWDRAQYATALHELRLHMLAERDLTADCRPRTFHQIDRLETINRLVHRVAPLSSLRAIMDAHHGGLALERLSRAGLVRYRMIIARLR